MDEVIRKKLNLILWHVRDIGSFVEAHAPFGEFMNRLCYLMTYGVIGKFVVEETTKDCVLVDVEHLIPREVKTKLVPDALDRPPLHIFPFCQSDASVPLAVVNAIKHKVDSQAFYSASQDCIFLNLGLGELEETERFMSTSLFHETGHALRALDEDRLGQIQHRSRQKRIQEELDMWLFDCKLAQILGGSKLQKAMHTTSEKIFLAHAVGKTYQGQPGVGKPLDACYRPVRNKKVQAGRDGTYIIFCALLAAKRFKDPNQILAYQRYIISTYVIGSKYDDEEEIIREHLTESQS